MLSKSQCTVRDSKENNPQADHCLLITLSYRFNRPYRYDRKEPKQEVHLLQVDAEIKVRRTTYKGCNQVAKTTVEGGKAGIVLPQTDTMLEFATFNHATHIVVVDRSDDVDVVGGED